MNWFKRVFKNKGEPEDNAFRKHGFKKVKKSNKKIHVRIKESVYSFDYETNVIYEIPREKIKFAIAVSSGEQLLFVNKDFIPVEGTTSPYRSFYDGLMKEPFKYCYPFDEQVIIQEKMGKRLIFSVVKV